MDIAQFDDIRPYNDLELDAAMKRIANNPLFANISSYLFPKQDINFFKDIILKCHTVDDFQNNVMALIVNKILSDTAKKLTYGGLENFDKDKKYLIISNHRDIVLDSAIIQLILHEENVTTSEIAVGDNLITSPFIEDISRSNKMIKVIRSSSPREVYTTSQRLSQYIRYNITSDKSSIWIAQRNGRTKDGADATEQGLLKMLEMSGNGDFIKDFSDLNIIPVSVSYEYEPCDLLKSVELFISRRRKYIKSKDEDLNSILTGIMQFKGNIHIQFNEPLTYEEISSSTKCDTNDKNEKYKSLAAIIDNKINSNYYLWKNNYIAYDLVNNCDTFANEYSTSDKQSFINYVKYKISSSEVDHDELEDIFLSIYSNPVKSKFKI
jgi:Acyltransferase.